MNDRSFNKKIGHHTEKLEIKVRNNKYNIHERRTWKMGCNLQSQSRHTKGAETVERNKRVHGL